MSLQYLNFKSNSCWIICGQFDPTHKVISLLQLATRVVIMAAERKYSQVLREGMSMVGAAVRGGCGGGGF
jgi:hypothetical protein